ncbi:MAG: hypothetical protein UU82_C0002G0026 [Candidatus Nomurabacteria bacterium GW2011_GWC2_41_8]|uniref:Uncharacterized protein n=3 Tax=Candidatus Nomuraibacteriota TaxID=1752729 RepID=A0A1F6YAI8_9BACT|nr:MAG: hypothetical protein UU58_C0002G0030 [Candidatus Nomurabacteria bacterium GW2011_GWA2_41_25]KKS24661.1 MAG: hypothetical protein UU82_C0002G0026 [Candidatus Nomurabacteria bacterium GW2011_GWC2_41_8]OGI67030.1 MAG: hypothetical protein A2823_02295 [Candidatus Nomurabacteria bacterium RIFCSPHIGHO2_01_FULL_41_91]OGI80960.1 MAG: hypothetical protein A3D43_01880 [Candidatus Nomurabacteria bacterium RIFCSPHIGHO2_02_FULL_41_52]OGI84531.1 MAG: hypothetical protein A3F49_02975 [Candidatus Nomur
MQIKTPDASSAGTPRGQLIELGGKKLRTMDNIIAHYSAGENGAELSEVVDHCEEEVRGYGLVNEEFLDELHADHTKIKELIDKLGETRDEVSIVARTADGGFTRMLLKKDADGHFGEIKEGVDSSDKAKKHRQEKDLFIFESGVKSAVA